MARCGCDHAVGATAERTANAVRTAVSRSLSRISQPTSERRPHRELDLPRRAGIAAGEPRVGDAAEVRAADDAPRLAEIGVVEDVERLDAELEAGRPGEPQGFRQREVGVVESRADDDIPPQVAEAAHRLERGRVEPAFDGVPQL